MDLRGQGHRSAQREGDTPWWVAGRIAPPGPRRTGRADFPHPAPKVCVRQVGVAAGAKRSSFSGAGSLGLARRRVDERLPGIGSSNHDLRFTRAHVICRLAFWPRVKSCSANQTSMWPRAMLYILIEAATGPWGAASGGAPVTSEPRGGWARVRHRRRRRCRGGGRRVRSSRTPSAAPAPAPPGLQRREEWGL